MVRELDVRKDKERALEIIKFLIETHKLDTMQLDNKGKNVLHLASGSFEKFRVLYDYLKSIIKP